MQPLFDETLLAGLVCRWQKAQPDEQPLIWREIVEALPPYLCWFIHSSKLDLRPLGPPEEIASELILKIHRLLKSYNPNSGSRFFSFVQCCLFNYCCTLLQRHYRYTLRYHVASDFIDAHPPVTHPEVHSLAKELSSRLEIYTAMDGRGFEPFVARNLVVYALLGWERGRDLPLPTLLDRISYLTQKLCNTDSETARQQTQAALEALRRELATLKRVPPIAITPAPPSESSASSAWKPTMYAAQLLSKKSAMNQTRQHRSLGTAPG